MPSLLVRKGRRESKESPDRRACQVFKASPEMMARRELKENKASRARLAHKESQEILVARLGRRVRQVPTERTALMEPKGHLER